MYESNLFTIREKNHLLQKDVANLLGISQQTYSLYELGLAVIPLIHLNTLCNYYKVNMDYLIGLSNHKEYLGKTLISLDKQLIGTRLKEVRMNHNISFNSFCFSSLQNLLCFFRLAMWKTLIILSIFCIFFIH